MNNKINYLKFGLLHVVIALPATLVVSSVMNIPITTMLFFAGIFTLIFHLLTKNKIPSVLSISGSYIGAILFVSSTKGIEYVGAGVIAAGFIYMILGFAASKNKDFRKYFPSWLLMLGVALIALSLIPIGVDLAYENQIVALVTVVVMFYCMHSKIKTFNMLPMAWALGAGTFTNFLIVKKVPQLSIKGLFSVPKIITEGFCLNAKFDIGAVLLISLIAIVTYFEMLADIQNTSNITGKDFFNEVGIDKISYANGLSTIISGAFGYPPFTTYSENAGALLITKYYNPNAQLITAVVFILASFFTPIFSLITYIPNASFGAILICLYGTLFINSLKEIMNDKSKDLPIIGIVFAMSYFTFSIGGVALSSVSTALIIGLVLNFIKVKGE